MNQPSSSPSLFGLSFGWAYALAVFTLTITSCLPLALLATMAGGGTGAERANALMAWLPIMAALVAIACALFFLGVRPESLRAMHYLFLSGEELARGEFKSMLGLNDRLATNALGALVRRGYLRSDSPQGKVRFGLPQHALRFLFPKLWPEAETVAL